MKLSDGERARLPEHGNLANPLSERLADKAMRKKILADNSEAYS